MITLHKYSSLQQMASMEIKDDNKKVIKASDDNFQKPINPAPRVKRKKVLDEDTYIKNIEEIIERDFFPLPALLTSQSDGASLDGSTSVIKGLDNSPETFETPEPFSRKSESERNSSLENGTSPKETSAQDKDIKKSKSDNLPSLDSYLNSYTSEDNDSFEELMNDSNERMREKHPWLFKKEQLALECSSGNLSVPSIEEQANPEQRPMNVDTWNYKNRNYIMYTPDNPSITEKHLQELVKTKNSIVYENTRFQQNPFNERRNQELIQQMAQTQAQQSLDGKIGIDGKELITDMSGTDGYSYVRTPSPMPGVQDSPLMTWGDIEGKVSIPNTPLVATPGPSFRIAGPSEREKLANNLTNEIRDKNKLKMQANAESKRRLVGSSPLLGSSSLNKMNMLSPAARHLATSRLKHIGTDSALRASYSPKTPGTLSTPHTSRLSNVQRTPLRSPGSSRSGISVSNHITDNLLNLPKRPR